MDVESEERFDRAQRSKWEDYKYVRARDGNHLMTTFECNLCIFVKLKGRYPLSSSLVDKKLIACISQVNLDAFWSRATSTINNNLRSIKKILATSRELNLPGQFIFCEQPIHLEAERMVRLSQMQRERFCLSQDLMKSFIYT